MTPDWTLDRLLRLHLPDGTHLTEWAESHGLLPRTLYRLRRGLTEKPHPATVDRIAAAIGIDAKTVRRSIAASRRARRRRASTGVRTGVALLLALLSAGCRSWPPPEGWWPDRYAPLHSGCRR